ncbi:MAG: hypothetical protein ABSC55_14985 [Syntrophorhabdales bacterium]
MSTLTSAASAFVADLSRTARGSAMGILGSIMDIGHTTGPLVAGIDAGSLRYSFSFISASAALVGVALVFAAVVLQKKHSV